MNPPSDSNPSENASSMPPNPFARSNYTQASSSGSTGGAGAPSAFQATYGNTGSTTSSNAMQSSGRYLYPPGLGRQATSAYSTQASQMTPPGLRPPPGFGPRPQSDVASTAPYTATGQSWSMSSAAGPPPSSWGPGAGPEGSMTEAELAADYQGFLSYLEHTAKTDPNPFRKALAQAEFDRLSGNAPSKP